MSSNEVVLKVNHVSKCFEMYAKPIHRLFQTLCWGKKNFYKEFWALEDISFELRRGECAGIIGRNGAGKSTLLQIIAGTLSPTSGSVETHGRIAALLELGSGFNPDFTGRENVYMNATILGLTSEQIDAKYQEILDFADIGDFISQPVKTYSSGMMMRLAFAVQAMVEPDILIIDEALGVGDARFQLKCAQRLEHLRKNGTTLLFVSHSIEQVKSLCQHGLLLERGKQVYWGNSKEACVRYMQLIFPEDVHTESPTGKKEAVSGNDSFDDEKLSGKYMLELFGKDMKCSTFGVGGAWLDWIQIYGLEKPNIFHGGETFTVFCKYSWDQEKIKSFIFAKNLKDDLTIGISLANKKGEYLFGCNGYDFGLEVSAMDKDSATVKFEFVMPYLANGDYFMSIAIALGKQAVLEHPIWYDYPILLHCETCKKNVYGILAVDYKMEI